MSELGKPSLKLKGAAKIHFNVSHSGDYGLIAISKEAVGVDIEKLQPRINAKSLVSQVLSQDELASWNRLSPMDHSTQIIRLWVCKEAILKAMGLGIAECLKQISFSLPIQAEDSFQPSRIDSAVQMHLEESGDCRCNPWLSTSNWIVRPIEIDREYFASVVTTRSCSTVELNDFQFQF